MKKTRYFLFPLLVALTFWIILRESSLTQIFDCLRTCSPSALAAAIGCMVVFVLCEAANLQRCLRLTGRSPQKGARLFQQAGASLRVDRVFLQRHHALCLRRSAHAALSHAQRRYFGSARRCCFSYGTGFLPSGGCHHRGHRFAAVSCSYPANFRFCGHLPPAWLCR